MVPYVEDDEDEGDYDEGSEEYDEDDVDEDDEEDYDEDEDFSYSEEDEEDEEDEDENEDGSLTENQYGARARRPALSNVWPDGGSAQNLSQFSGSEHRAAMPDVKLPSDNLIPGQHHQILESDSALNAQEPNRPRRTDSGVEVKLSPHLQRASANGNNSSEDRKIHRFTVSVVNNKHPSALPDTIPKVASPGPSVATTPTHHPKMKSDGDISERGQLLTASSSLTRPIIDGTQSVGVSSGSGSSQTARPNLKSSISCHTLPRAAGKRVGRKHVSWHHSLFPTERVLRVKPSLPSLSTVAAESAKATLSQLPSIPAMARDNVKDFHQSIRSLRALSRDEITKMSYKQQGRQELMSPIPISKSAVDSIPWWSPSRWLKNSAIVDKRHWKTPFLNFILFALQLNRH
ncbi:hypothetical protein BGZ68_001393 [Mortierella alpina]|nr:hypothetical protein BGZ68_001393 [Mortierella alpina]